MRSGRTQTTPWSAAEKARAIGILKRHTDGRAALVEICEKVRPLRSWSALAHSLPMPGQYLRPEPVESLMERHQAKADDKRLRTENRDLLDRIEQLQKQADARRQLSEGNVAPVVMRDLKRGKRQGTAVLLASDWHVEEVVPAGSTPVANQYDLATAERRIERFFSSARWLIDFHRPVFGMADVVLWLGGDFITGTIHDDPIRDLGPGAATVWVEQRIRDGVKYLLEDREIKRLSVICSYGNHGRTTVKPRRSTGAAHSWEWLMYQHLGQSLRGMPRVQFEATPVAHQYLKVYGYDLHFHHGDEVSYYGGSGGITIPINKAIAQWDKWRPCYCHNFGHFHQYLDLGYAVVNGSLIGAGPYGMSIKATPEPPQQSFYVIDSTRGKTCKSPMWVSE